MKWNLSRRVSCCMLAALSLAVTANAATFSVNSPDDAIDKSPGDGICETDAGACTLRAAIMEANALSGADLIDLTAIDDPASPVVLTLHGVDESWVPTQGSEIPCEAQITADAAIGDLDITEDLEIVGAGPGLTVIEWDSQSLVDPDIGDRVFHVQAEPETTVNLVRIADLMIRKGSVGIPNSLDSDNAYNCEEPTGPVGSRVVWQFKRVGGGIAVGPGAAVFLFEESEHGPGGGGMDEGPPSDPGGEEEGGVVAVEVERIAMIGNQAGSDGGALLSAAELTVIDSVFSGNLSAANGGAMYLDSATTIRGTLIGTSASDVPFDPVVPAALLSQPNVAENGGAIFDTGSHTTNIEASAINGNQAIGGGGIAARSMVVINLVNSTVSGNTGTDVGGGITTNGQVNLSNVTVADNVATTDAPGGGAGLNSFGSGTFVFYNSILSNNRVLGGDGHEEVVGEREANCGCSGGTAQCPTGRMVSTGHNINDETLDTCSLSVALGDQLATDPLLKPLANNGGLTETHALASAILGDPETSPAVDKGDSLRCPNNDQRGSLRPDDGNGDGGYDCDIGAFELFIARADLHISNVTAPNRVRKHQPFTVVVEIHNADSNVDAVGVEYIATLDDLVNMNIVSATPSVGSCDVPSHTVTCTLGDMLVGEIATVELTLVGNSQGSFALESVANTDSVDPVPGNNTVLTNIFVLGIADVAISGDPVPAVVDQGDTMTFGYAVTNNGADEATSVRVGMQIPSSASFVSASSTNGTCADSAGEVLCTIGTLALAESAIIEIKLSADAAGEAEFTAVVSAEQDDTDSSNNSVVAAVTMIANAELELSGTAPASITVGNEFNVVVTVANNGPQDATNVLVTAEVPALLGFVSAADCELAEAVLECAGGALAAGESKTFTLRFSAATVGTATVSAAVSADQNDPDEDNNADTLRVTVNPVAQQVTTGGGGGGGCVYSPGSPADPTLPLLLLVALTALAVRQRAHA